MSSISPWILRGRLPGPPHSVVSGHCTRWFGFYVFPCTLAEAGSTWRRRFRRPAWLQGLLMAAAHPMLQSYVYSSTLRECLLLLASLQKYLFYTCQPLCFQVCDYVRDYLGLYFLYKFGNRKYPIPLEVLLVFFSYFAVVFRALFYFCCPRGWQWRHLLRRLDGTADEDGCESAGHLFFRLWGGTYVFKNVGW